MTKSDTRTTKQGETRKQIAERTVYDAMNFHPDVPLSPRYRKLADIIEAALKEREGCQHCICPCVNCGPCGEDQG